MVSDVGGKAEDDHTPLYSELLILACYEWLPWEALRVDGDLRFWTR